MTLSATGTSSLRATYTNGASRVRRCSTSAGSSPISGAIDFAVPDGSETKCGFA